MLYDSVMRMVEYQSSHQGFVSVVEEDGTLSLYPQRDGLKGKIVWRLLPCEDGVQFAVQSMDNCSNWSGQTARDMREATDLMNLFIEYYGGGERWF